jgi:hypothetical protein
LSLKGMYLEPSWKTPPRTGRHSILLQDVPLRHDTYSWLSRGGGPCTQWGASNKDHKKREEVTSAGPPCDVTAVTSMPVAFRWHARLSVSGGSCPTVGAASREPMIRQAAVLAEVKPMRPLKLLRMTPNARAAHLPCIIGNIVLVYHPEPSGYSRLQVGWCQSSDMSPHVVSGSRVGSRRESLRSAPSPPAPPSPHRDWRCATHR